MDSYLQQLNRTYDANPADQDAAAHLIAALRRALGGQEVSRYKPRGLPCNITSDENLWCVCGSFTDETGGGGGVLEWCYDEDDANQRMLLMQRDPRYSNLSASRYENNREPGLSLADLQLQVEDFAS